MNAPLTDLADDGAATPLWLLTFADLTAILVALFVLMYSMSVPLTGSGRNLLSGGAAEAVLSTSAVSADRLSGRSEHLAVLTVGYLSAVLSDRGIAPLAQNGAQAAPVTQSIEGDRLVLHVASDFAFSADGRTLKPIAEELVSDLVAVLSNVANPVSIFAAVPENNWTLAFDRADDVVGAFRRFGYAAPIERFVTPSIMDAALVIVVGRVGGSRS